MVTEKPKYHRYHIPVRSAPNIVPHPRRFNVHVSKPGLALFLLKELFEYRLRMSVILSRPCMYGVFSGPVGGFSPRPDVCVGCLRCTTQYLDMVTVSHNPERKRLGDSYVTPDQVDAIMYEAESARIPVRGAGYRGRFGGEGWDGMWTDMSEIVRPTRDGIHGREFISTVVDIGRKPALLDLDDRGELIGKPPLTLSIPLPMLFDLPPSSLCSPTLWDILTRAAAAADTLALMPVSAIPTDARWLSQRAAHVVPVIRAADREALGRIGFAPPMVELEEWEEELYDAARSSFPDTVIALRVPFEPGFEKRLTASARSGVHVFHLAADYHGRSPDGAFALELIRKAHTTFVEAGIRDEVTLIGSGGMIAAEHIPKAIICGVDAVALDIPLLIALQARLQGECIEQKGSLFELPSQLSAEWGAQRLQNLLASWRDQLLEVLGAMGLREVRRLRGEVGRAMFCADLEREAFSGIEGYGDSEKKDR